MSDPSDSAKKKNESARRTDSKRALTMEDVDRLLRRGEEIRRKIHDEFRPIHVISERQLRLRLQ